MILAASLILHPANVLRYISSCGKLLLCNQPYLKFQQIVWIWANFTKERVLFTRKNKISMPPEISVDCAVIHV